MTTDYTVSIDFGTTNSVVAHGTEAAGEVLPMADGHTTVPSVVSFESERAYAGVRAAERGLDSPADTVWSVKRGLTSERLAITPDAGGEYAPEQAAALLLDRLRTRAERSLDGDVAGAVLPVPANFGRRGREAVRRAGAVAGLDDVHLLDEPTAACLAYGVQTSSPADTETVLVYDLGGGTFDVSLVEVTGTELEVVATAGDAHLGGDDWDGRTVEWLLDEVVTNRSLERSSADRARLLQAAREAKHDLSDADVTTVEVTLSDGSHHEAELTRSRFEELTSDLTDRTIDLCERVISDVNWNAWTLDEVLLVGGATRMPQVREAVEEFFGQASTEAVDPEEAVALGGAVYAATTDDLDAPASDPPPGLDVGVVPESLGVEAAVDGTDGQFSPIVERGCEIPVTVTKQYRTHHDGQTGIDVRVFRGDQGQVADNEFLTEFQVDDIPNAEAGEVGVEVTFDVSDSGVLRVEAVSPGGGRAATTVEEPFERVSETVRRMRLTLPPLASAPESEQPRTPSPQ